MLFFRSFVASTCLVCFPMLNAQLPVEIREVKKEAFLELMEEKSDRIYLVHFWATWCRPCVKELPFYQRIADSTARVIMVSLDFNMQVLRDFMSSRELPSEQWWLNEPREQEWMPLISNEWTGAIPASLFLHPASGNRFFYEGESSGIEEILDLIRTLRKAWNLD
jgi:thiol-disulfide isomerase/thioredoxin